LCAGFGVRDTVKGMVPDPICIVPVRLDRVTDSTGPRRSFEGAA